jgi:hypothetical protein
MPRFIRRGWWSTRGSTEGVGESVKEFAQKNCVLALIKEIVTGELSCVKCCMICNRDNKPTEMIDSEFQTHFRPAFFDIFFMAEFALFKQKSKNPQPLAETHQPLVDALINFIKDATINRSELYLHLDDLISNCTDPFNVPLFKSESEFILFISTILHDETSDLSSKLPLLQSCIKTSSSFRVIESILDFIISDIAIVEILLKLAVDLHPISVIEYLLDKLDSASTVPEYTFVLQTINLIRNIASYSYPSIFFLSRIKSFLSAKISLAGDSELLDQVEKLVMALYGGDDDRVFILISNYLRMYLFLIANCWGILLYWLVILKGTASCQLSPSWNG